MVVATVFEAQRETASDYLASTAAPAEWFTPYCSALLYCVQKIHQCEHQPASGTPLRRQSIPFHAAQPWPVLGCLQNTTYLTCLHVSVSVLRVCTCICLCDSVLQLSELKQTMKRLTLGIFSMKKERQSPGHLKHAHLYNSGWITGFYLSTVSSIVVIKYGLGVFMQLITTFLCKTPLAANSTSSHWSDKYPLFQPKTLCTMFKVSIARCNQVLNKSVLLQH